MMESAGNGGWNSPSVEEVGSEITLTNFDGLTLYPRMARIPGMEKEDVLPPPAAVDGPSGPSIVNRVSSWWVPSATGPSLRTDFRSGFQASALLRWNRDREIRWRSSPRPILTFLRSLRACSMR